MALTQIVEEADYAENLFAKSFWILCEKQTSLDAAKGTSSWNYRGKFQATYCLWNFDPAYNNAKQTKPANSLPSTGILERTQVYP